jgi:hypothetical protein
VKHLSSSPFSVAAFVGDKSVKLYNLGSGLQLLCEVLFLTALGIAFDKLRGLFELQQRLQRISIQE